MKCWIKNIKKTFDEPFPLLSDTRKVIVESLFLLCFITIFLWWFRPFGFDTKNSFFLICLGFGLITGATTFLAYQVIGFYYKEPKWTLGKQLLYSALVIEAISICNMIYSNTIFDRSSWYANFLLWQGFTFSIGVLPTFLIIVLRFLWAKNKYAEKVAKLEPSHYQLSSILKEKQITINGQNKDETISLQSSQLLYVESSQNYVSVFYLKEGQIDSVVFRNSLKNIEKQLEAHPQFVRSHRAFVVNMNKVEKVTGNAQGYKLHLTQSTAQIPVSRSLNSEIETHFSSK